MAVPDIDVAYLVALFPEFTPVDEAAETALEARLEAWNPPASQYVDENVFGDQAKYGNACLVAHFLSESAVGAGAGNVASEKVGDVAITYQAPTGSAAEEAFGSTRYGRLYLTLRDSKVLPGKFANPRRH